MNSEATAATGMKEIVFSDREEAEAHVASVARSISNVDYSPDDFHLAYAGGAIGRCSVHRGVTSALKYKVSESGDLHFVFMQDGAAQFAGGRANGESLPQRKGLVLGPGAHGSFAVEPGGVGLSLITSEKAVRDYASRLMGDERAIAIDASRALSVDLGEPVAATLVRNLVGAFHELQALGRSGLSKVAMGNFDEILLGLSSVAVSREVREFVREEQPLAGSNSVRLACEYMQAHAANPVSLSELAERLGIGLRSLQLAFRRELGCSPREYLTACRLELARQRLLSDNVRSTVTEIALECGFTDMANFARKYRLHFGERPSQTLRRR